MATYSQEISFVQSVIPRSILDDAIDWISKNLNPDDVFKASDLDSWAEDNGYVKKDE